MSIFLHQYLNFPITEILEMMFKVHVNQILYFVNITYPVFERIYLKYLLNFGKKLAIV